MWWYRLAVQRGPREILWQVVQLSTRIRDRFRRTPMQKVRKKPATRPMRRALHNLLLSANGLKER